MRYQRRVEKRRRKRIAKSPNADNYEQIFSFDNLWKSYRKCRRKVTWKGSVQRYVIAAPIRVSRAHRELMHGKYKCVTPHEWDTWERGKKRHIKSVPIGERVVQRCLADQSLVPTLKPMFIYDNGACLQYKGYDFAVRRLNAHLHQYYRKYGSDGYILMFDFSKFYDRVDHDLIRQTLQRRLTDRRNLSMVDNIMATFGPVGLGLGSQISQILALASANDMDHCIKQELKIKYYARYNDDGYLIHPSKKYLKYCLQRIQQVCDRLHIKLNEKKTQIVKLSHGFKFLKARVYLTKTGKVVRKIPKERITIVRRKLKKLVVKYRAGERDLKAVENMYEGYRAYAKKYFMYWKTIKNSDRLYYQLLPEAPRLAA